LADAGLTAALVLANLHHRQIVSLMERRLRIFEMEETTDPVALAQSRLLRGLFQQEYAATRARRAVNLMAMRVDDTALWAFTMVLRARW
jgi:Tfp pilus assembly pilus retraction ATPase PilT